MKLKPKMLPVLGIEKRNYGGVSVCCETSKFPSPLGKNTKRYAIFPVQTFVRLLDANHQNLIHFKYFLNQKNS